MHKGLKQGDAIREVASGAEFYVMNSWTIDGCIPVLDRSTHTQRFLPLRDVYEQISNQTLTVHRKDAPVVSVTEHESHQFLERLKWATSSLRKVLNTAKELGISFDKAFRLVRAECKGEPFPNRSSLYRFKTRHLNGLPILKGDKNKGRRSSHYKPEVYELIISMAPEYCQPHSRWRMSAFAQRVNQTAKDMGLILPTQTISQRHIHNTLRRNGYVDTDVQRMPVKNRKAARSIGAQRIHTEYPFERVEMDTVHLPFVVQTPSGIAKHIHCIQAIDVMTGMVLGWNIVVGHPSESDGLDCIRSILFPKKEAFKRLGLDYDFDVFGTPSLIVFDNGAEAKGERIERLLLIGIDTEHCPARGPNKKPFIESFNKRLKCGLETLPGCTRFNGVDGVRDPEAEGDKLMSLEELERYVVRWYYEQWGTHTLERHLFTDPQRGCTPVQRWKYFSEDSGYVMPLPVTPDDWHKVTLVKTVRKLSSKTGVTYQGLDYKGPNLTSLIQRFYEKEVTIYADPRDYRVIYVDDGTQLVPLTEEYVRSDSAAYTLEQEKERRRELKRQNLPTEATQFERDVWAKSTESRTPKAAKKTTVRNRQTTEKYQHSQAVQRAIDKPVATDIMSEFVTQLSSLPTDFLNLPTLDVLDRTSGEEKA